MSPIKSLWFLALAAIALTVVACDNANCPTNDPLDVPAVYPSADYDANVVDQAALRTGLINLNAEMQKGRTGETLNGAQLSILYTDIQSETTPYYNTQVENWLVEIVKASEGDTYDPMASPQENGEGGVYSGYLYDEYGIEIQQEVEKVASVSIATVFKPWINYSPF